MTSGAEITARLQGLEQLGDLVQALRSMAGSRVHQAQDALAGTEGFRKTIEGAILSLPVGDHLGNRLCGWVQQPDH